VIEIWRKGAWLRRLELLYNIARNNIDRRRPYNFDFGKYDEEQLRGGYWITKS
jgi:hypothetical protein